MSRAMWKGSIGFGLVSIPVSLTPAVRQQDIRFSLFHDEDGGRIKEKRVCEKDGAEVPYEHVVKGHPITKDRIVLVTQDELKKLKPVGDRIIDVEAFVEVEEVDPVFFERHYHVQPEGKAAEKAYALFSAALKNSGKAALGRIVLSTKEHLALVRVFEHGLMLSTMVFDDEVVEAPSQASPSTSAKEVKMAEALIEQMAAPFEPAKYHDEYRAKVMDLLHKKDEGKEVVQIEAEERPHVTDLSDALERSLAAAKGKGGRAAKPHARLRDGEGKTRHRLRARAR